MTTPSSSPKETIRVVCSECKGAMSACVETTYGPTGDATRAVLVDWTEHRACVARILARGGSS